MAYQRRIRKAFLFLPEPVVLASARGFPAHDVLRVDLGSGCLAIIRHSVGGRRHCPPTVCHIQPMSSAVERGVTTWRSEMSAAAFVITSGQFV